MHQAKRSGVKHLRQQDDRKRIDTPTDHEPSQNPRPNGEKKEGSNAKTPFEGIHPDKKDDFRENTQRPKLTDRGILKAVIAKQYGIKGVVRTVRDLNQKPRH